MKERQFKIYRGSLDSTASSTLSYVGSERIYFALNRTEASGDLMDTEKFRFPVESIKSLPIQT